jgi:putative ABC transport system permease protein
VLLLGVDDATLIGAPSPDHMVIGRVDRLRIPDAVLVDQFSCELLWREDRGQFHEPKDYERFIGRTFEMNDHRAVVTGICRASPNFQTLPIVYTTFSRAKQFVPPERKLMPFVLVKVEDGVPLKEVSEGITTRTAHLLKARTQEEVVWDTIWYYITRTGIPMNFLMTVGLGFLVGTAIAGQTFYQFTIENLKQFGALKAMGTSNRRILGMILLQALIVGPLGFSFGVGLAALFGVMVQDDPSMAFYMPWQVLVLTGTAVMLICLLASLLSIRRVLVLEPAIVFRV